MELNKVKEFAKKHKVKLIIAAAAVGGVIAYAATRGKNSDFKELMTPELSDGKWLTLYTGIKGKDKGNILGAVDDVPLAALGVFGENLTAIDGMDSDDTVRILFGQSKYYKT